VLLLWVMPTDSGSNASDGTFVMAGLHPIASHRLPDMDAFFTSVQEIGS
jgi:hypothetical protein